MNPLRARRFNVAGVRDAARGATSLQDAKRAFAPAQGDTVAARRWGVAAAPGAAVCEPPYGGRSAQPTQGGVEGLLGKIRSSVSTSANTPELPEKKSGVSPGSGRLRREMYALREAMWQHQVYPEQQKCGRLRYGPDLVIMLAPHERLPGKKRGYAKGLKKCRNPRTCPVCSMSIAFARGETVAQAVGAWAQGIGLGAPPGGGGVALVTFTLRHDRESELASLADGLRAAMRRMRQGRWWQDWKERWGYAGEVQALEATHGWANSWHPHLHSLMFFERRLTEDERRQLEGELFDRWHACVVKELGGRHAPNADHAVDVSIGDQAGWYLTKLGLEVSSPATKQGSDGNRSHWQIAADIAKDGRPADIALWQEFARAFRGKAQVTWSTGRHDIRKRLGLKDADKTDEEIVDQEDESDESDESENEIAAVIPGDFADAFVRARVNAVFRLIEAAEQGGAAAVDEVIRRLLVEVAKWERERRRGRGPPARAA